MARALYVCVLNENFIDLLGYTFPVLRCSREYRAIIDSTFLRNVIWGRDCMACDRHSPRTFVFTYDDDVGRPFFYACFLCYRGQYDEELYISEEENATPV